MIAMLWTDLRCVIGGLDMICPECNSKLILTSSNCVFCPCCGLETDSLRGIKVPYKTEPISRNIDDMYDNIVNDHNDGYIDKDSYL